MNVCIVGRGKLGKSLHMGLREAGVSARLVPGRTFAKRKIAADTFILAVPDAQIAPVAAQLARFVERGTVVLHCAGSRGPGELSAVAQRGAHVAGFHPLVSFASARQRASLAGATFVVHGDAQATRRARVLARQLGAHAVALPALGPAYHAAAALVANGGAALVHAGVAILRELGFAQRDAERALAALLSSVARNVSLVGVPRALTGPVSRGDAETVAKHVASLAQHSPTLAASYRAVQPLVLACARDQGLSPARARAIERALAAKPRR